eukprot:1353021-Prymnesium_polylepis.1
MVSVAEPPTPSATPKAPIEVSAKKASSPPLCRLPGCGSAVAPKRSSRCPGLAVRPEASPWNSSSMRLHADLRIRLRRGWLRLCAQQRAERFATRSRSGG